MLLSFTDRLIINLLVDSIRVDLALTDTDISLLQGLGFGLIYAFCGLPMGRLADRTNRRNLIMAAITIWSLGTLGCGLVHSFAQFFAARMVVGLGEAILVPAAASMIADYFPPSRRGAALGLFAVGAMLGSGFGITLCGWLLSAIQGGMLSGVPLVGTLPSWRSVLIIAGTVGFPLLVAVALISEPTRKDSAGPLRFGAMWRYVTAEHGKIARIGLAIGIVAAGDYGLLSWLPALLERAYGYDPARTATLVGFSVSVPGIVGSVGAGALSDWIVRRRGIRARALVMLTAFLLCLGAGLMLTNGSATVLLSALAIWVLGSVAGNTVGITVLQECVPNEMRATTVAFCNMCSALIGLALGPSSVVLAAHWISGDKGTLAAGIAAVTITAAFSGVALIATVGVWRASSAATRGLAG
jgi:MFS family permease